MIGELALLAGLLTIANLLFAAWLSRRRYRWIRTVIQEERTRSLWAEAREEMFALARAGKVPIRSETFRTFYGLQTFVMRRPEAYDQFSKQIAKGLFEAPKKAKPSWSDEVKDWPQELAPVLMKMAHGIEMLALGYSGRRRVLWFLVTRVFPWLAVHASKRVIASAADSIRAAPWVRAELRLAKSKARIERLIKSLEDHPANELALAR